MIPIAVGNTKKFQKQIFTAVKRHTKPVGEAAAVLKGETKGGGGHNV